MAKMEVSLRATGLWDSFAPHIFSCYDIGDHKPSPGIYLHALERMGRRTDAYPVQPRQPVLFRERETGSGSPSRSRDFTSLPEFFAGRAASGICPIP